MKGIIAGNPILPKPIMADSKIKVLDEAIQNV